MRSSQLLERVHSVVDGLDTPDGLRVVVPHDYVTVGMSEGNPWVLAPDYGITVEDELRDGRLPPPQRIRLVNTLIALRTAMLEAGFVWQGFAPRNMFRRGGELVLIDFEETADLAEEPVRAAECLCWHEVFFADCFTPDERNRLFRHHPRIPLPADDHRLVADDFEQALLQMTETTWQQRKTLLSQSASLEGRHTRPSDVRDGGVLFGHELGHFWGDFLPVEIEVSIFAALMGDVPADVRVACLEVFEAAMEADIDALLTAAAVGDRTPTPARTIALAQALGAAGPVAMADIRSQRPDWYEQLPDGPARLVDETVFALSAPAGAAQAGNYLVGTAGNRNEHRRRLGAAIDTGMAFLHGDRRGERFLDHAEPDHLRKLLSEPLPLHGTEFDSMLADVDDRIVRYSISQAHSGYLAFPDTGNSVAALAGSMLTRLLNQNLIAVDRSAPAATFATIQVVEWLRELVGYQSLPITEMRGVRDVAGLWTTGGHLSNHIAMLTALGHAFPQARTHGLRSLDVQPAVVMAGPIAHYSHSDSAFHLGLGWDAVLTVPARADYTTDPDAVDAMLANPPDGVKPFMVIGVAGNCRTTGLDDLVALAEVCRRHGVWFHADACHGGSLIFDEALRARCLAGIELADSVSLDPHKGLFTPYPSSYVVFRDRGVLTQFSRHAAAVAQDGCWDLGLITPFLGSAGFEALPTWMLLKHIGVRQLGAIVEARHALVRHLERRLDDTGLFVRLNDVDFYRVAFGFCPAPVRAAVDTLDAAGKERARRVVSTVTSQINEQLYREGLVCFDEHTLADLDDRIGLGAGAGYTIMAACPGNPLTTIDDLEAAMDRLVRAARPLIPRMLDMITDDSRVPTARASGPAGWNDQ